MTDIWTDELFAPLNSSRCVIKFPVSRLVCNPERFRDDKMESMSAKGMGAVYTKTADGEKLRELDNKERERILCSLYDPHHERLFMETRKLIESSGRCVIIDCHSFSAEPLPYEDNKILPRPDFCIGTDDFHTPTELAELCASFLSNKGYDVELNRPYSGAIVPKKYYGIDKRVISIMIEINRGLYMCRSEKSVNFNKIRETIQELLTIVETWMKKE